MGSSFEVLCNFFNLVLVARWTNGLCNRDSLLPITPCRPKARLFHCVACALSREVVWAARIIVVLMDQLFRFHTALHVSWAGNT